MMCTVQVPVPFPGIVHFFWWYRNRYRKKLVPEKSLGTGIGKIWYRKKVPEPVSEKFGTGKKYQYRNRKYLAPDAGKRVKSENTINNRPF